ncbi:hypothetical protein HDU86_007445 [Geranomyces michiganensis]|nr:hypothetical protein HDU86_007445 [Geranomyces michiganensis]
MLSVLSAKSPTTSRANSPFHSALKHASLCNTLPTDQSSQVDYALDFESWSGSDSENPTAPGCASRQSVSPTSCQSDVKTFTSSPFAQEDRVTVEASDRETMYRMMAELGMLEQSLAEARAQEELEDEEHNLQVQNTQAELSACKGAAPPGDPQQSIAPFRQRCQIPNASVEVKPPVLHKDVAAKVTLQEKAVKELLETLQKDQCAAQAAERQINTILSRPSIQSEVEPIVLDMHNSAAKLSAETTRQSEELSRLRAMVQEFWNHIRDPKPGQAYIIQIQGLMESIESHVMIQKTASYEILQTLVRQQNKLNSELTAFQDHMAGWDQAPADDPHLVKHPGKAVSVRAPRVTTVDDGSLLPEIVAYQNFVARHGRFGGWEEFAHRAFLRLREKNSSTAKDAFLRAVVARIPGINLSEAESHAAWHESFLRLTEARKSAIKRWKSRKAVAAEDQEKEMEAHETAVKISCYKGQAIHVDRDAQKRELEAWKEQKRAEEVALEQQQTAEAAARKSQEARCRDHQRMLRERVKTYQQERYARDLLTKKIKLEAEQRERDLHAKMALEGRKRLAEKNLGIVQKRREAEAARKQAEEEKEQRLDAIRKQVEVHAPRDPSRILRPTESFQTKIASPSHDPSEQVKGLFRTNPIPKRHVPDWRREL